MVLWEALAIPGFLWKVILPCMRCNNVTLINKHICLVSRLHLVDEETGIQEAE